ncbi:MAG: RNA 2',3'-cyclic phosphodiesterase [Actinomycetota bacterium]
MSGKALRLFVAAGIPSEARDILGLAMDGSRAKIADARWVSAENLHLTLKFIGAYGEEALEGLSNELLETAARCKPFKAALGGCGAFPSPRKARVIWVGMCEGAESAGAVARKLDARLERVGIERESRPFRGHITLARMKHPRDCAAALEDLGKQLGGLQDRAFTVDEVVLYHSILGPQGPTYIALQRVALGGNSHE